MMASVRAGCLPLGIEIGHYRIPKIPLGQRVCLVCSDGAVEDEYHFVVSCAKLTKERNNLFHHTTVNDPSFMQLGSYDKFLYILMKQSPLQSNVAKHLYIMFKVHSSFVFYDQLYL